MEIMDNNRLLIKIILIIKICGKGHKHLYLDLLERKTEIFN